MFQAQLKECEKQQNLWHKRLVSLKKMLNTFEASGCPHAPSTVHVCVTGQVIIGNNIENYFAFNIPTYSVSLLDQIETFLEVLENFSIFSFQSWLL